MKKLLLLLIIPLIYLPCYISNEKLIQYTREDGPYEWIGAILFLLTAMVYMLLVIRPNMYNGVAQLKKYPQRGYFFFLAVLFFFGFGEEISWGQRIFDFSTPEMVQKVNLQREFNLHNTDIFHGKTADGKEKTGIHLLFTMHVLYYLFFLTYLFIIPLFARMNNKFKRFITRIKLPVSSIFFGVLFIFNLAYGNTIRAIFTELKGHGVVEIKETVMALILFLFSLSFLKLRKSRDGDLIGQKLPKAV